MDISKYKALYLQEAAEHLSSIEEELLTLEKTPEDGTAIQNLFRHYHSIKGMSASMGYEPIMMLAHRQEDLLDRARQKEIRFTGEMLAALLACLDGMKHLVGRVETDAPLDVDIKPFLDHIDNAVKAKPVDDGPKAQPPEALKPPAQAPAGPSEEAPGGGAEKLRLPHVMKVEGSVFDGLLATVGDLFMALSMFKGLSSGSDSVELKDGVHMLGKSINTLHASILSARMLPVDDLMAGLPRVIRDMAKSSGKKVELKTEGTSLSLDRAILESLGSPLVHIIRNSMDHGIETPEQRRAAGKLETAEITVRAYDKKERAVIEVSDDGRGIDAAKVKQKAIAGGVPENKVRAMSDSEALMLVCLPGLSSADKVTDTSGRGVGMDVVKAAIEGLGGSLGIESVPGKGTRIIMELPRTTSIIKALLVTVGNEQFLIPISRIEKVLEVEGSLGCGSICAVDGADAPVLPLGDLLGMDEGPGRDVCTLIVAEAPGRPEGAPDGGRKKNLIAFRVDDFGDEIDAYIKPLIPPISRLWGVAGIAIMGDGRPVFLLDMPQILSRAVEKLS